MTDFAISVRDVVKQYQVRHSKGRTLKEAFLRQNIYHETIKALDHVSFDVKPGITMGIIGSNGSGKSTMLKLIARTSRPTSGEVIVNGRVSALLELGAGFHPDFSGRENVFLDGAIMGLPRRVVEERFDEIVAFAEMEEFIDAPAKTYSSGMYMRLAFSVAVSVDPDIILIDEVFAVGDESFQRKCLERIDSFKSEGKTILFVSHSLAAVRGLCDEAIWINKGKLSAQGSTDKVTDYYLWAVNKGDEDRLSAEEAFESDLNRWGTRRGEITAVEFFGGDGEPKHLFNTSEKLRVKVSYRATEELREPVFGIGFYRSDGVYCFACNSSETGRTPAKLKAGAEGEMWFEIEDLSLLPGDYQVSVSFHDLEQTETYDYHDRKYRFKVLKGPEIVIGLFNMPHRWTGWPELKA
ncbi:MAG: ABC transporter ATP-binding protein [Actinobacteria bacterium]|nr:ABC transporter ATP-binding protein [Actinomycetota bacterium]